MNWTITNPPFRLAQPFIERARRTSIYGVAIFCRSAFAEGGERYAKLFAPDPPSAILQFSERVVLHKSAMRQKGEKYWVEGHVNAKGEDVPGQYRSASSATAYCWMVWEPSKEAPDFNGPRKGLGTEFVWIPPCSDQLERKADYAPRGF